MSDFDPSFEILLEKSGRVLSVSEYELSQDFTRSTDSFSFTHYSENIEDLTGLELQPVTISIEGRAQLVGRIDATDQGENGSAITCEGRDYISDLVECNIDPRLVFADGITVQDAILLLCGVCGIKSVKPPGERISKRTGKPVNVALHRLTGEALKDLKPQAGRGLYETGEELLARFGLTLQPMADRSSVAIQPPTYDQPSLGRITRRRGETANNVVMSGKARRDYSSFPTHCTVTGKQGGAAEVGGAKGSLSQRRTSEILAAFPSEIRTAVSGSIVDGLSNPSSPISVADGSLYRLLYHQDQVGKTPKQNANAMMRAISDRLVETLVYTCTLRGHVNPVTGYTWGIDTIVDIDDDMANVHEPMWCRAATFRNRKKGGGPTTQLTFIRPSTYQIFAEG